MSTRKAGTHRTSNIVPGQLAERVWVTKSQSSLLNIYFRLSGFHSSLLLVHFRYGPNTYLFTLHQSVAQDESQSASFEIGAAQLRSVTEIAPKSPFLCVNRSPFRYGFRGDAKAIRYSKNIAFGQTVVRLVIGLICILVFTRT